MSGVIRNKRRGFTLIELLVAISISMIILSVLYFSLTAALESWSYTREEMSLQGVMVDLLEEVLEGNDWESGFRSALEVTDARPDRVSFVPPQTEQFTADGGRETFGLTRYVKPGSGLPTFEAKAPDAASFRPIPVSWEDPDRISQRPRVRADSELASGTTVRASYRPDPDRSPEAVVTVGWDSEQKALYRERLGDRQYLGENRYGVEIADCVFRAYDHANHLLAEGNSDVSRGDLPLITAIEVEISGRLGTHTLSLKGMIMLRNSIRHGGLVILQDGLKVPVPDGRSIHTFSLVNLNGITHGDEIQLELRPPHGASWRVTVRFERYGSFRPIIEDVKIEYPPGKVVHTLRPRSDADEGLDFLSIGPGGLYDYDDDPAVDDAVQVEGDPVILIVRRMDVQGAACFIQP